jgi:hypothetical protein
MIRFLQRRQLNDAQWNRVIAASGFETAYAHTWYLDACAEEWGGMIMPDYAYVMPVVFHKKYGFKYTYQPRFCQQLGVYSEKPVNAEISKLFLHALRKKFKLGNYAFNEGNLLGEEPGFEITDNANYTLQLQANYEEIKKAYTENCRRNVRKANQSGLTFRDHIPISELVLLKQKHDKVKFEDKHYQMLIHMFSGLLEGGHVKSYGVLLDGEICAGAIFACCNKRMHYLLSVSTWEGKDLRGMFMVLDSVIQLNAGKDMCLDFEGSNISSVARFFKGFGAQAQLYQRIRFVHAAGDLIQKIKNVWTD